MAEETSVPQTRKVAGESPGGRPMGAFGITLVTLYLVMVTIVVFHSLVVLWPPNRNAEPVGTAMTGTAGSEAEAKKPELDCDAGAPGEQLHAGILWLDFCLSDEERLFLIVMFAGALGGLVHAVRSFYWYAGCRKLVLSWTGFYITLPVLGAAMATVFYLVVRGGFFSPQSEISDTSPFGFAALAALIGMFTEQAAVKLKQITETVLANAETGTDHAGPKPAGPAVTRVTPSEGPQAGGTEVTIAGTGFAQGDTVTFGGNAATVLEVAGDGTSIKARTPAAAAPGAVAVEVTGAGGKKGSLADGFTYLTPP